jgi:hypothetical protein
MERSGPFHETGIASVNIQVRNLFPLALIIIKTLNSKASFWICETMAAVYYKVLLV